MTEQPGDPSSTPDPDEHLIDLQTVEEDAIVRERLGLDDADR